LVADRRVLAVSCFAHRSRPPVIETLPQGRQVQSEDAQAVVEVAAKGPSRT
jgi:hypothetical protein